VQSSTGRRRPFVRFFACRQDLSPDDPLPEAVVWGEEPLLVGRGHGRRLSRPVAAAILDHRRTAAASASRTAPATGGSVTTDTWAAGSTARTRACTAPASGV